MRHSTANHSSYARGHSASGKADYERMTEPMAVRLRGKRALWYRFPHQFADAPDGGRVCRLCGHTYGGMRDLTPCRARMEGGAA